MAVLAALERLWRVGIHGLGFLGFGLVALVLTLILLPAVTLLPLSEPRRRELTRRAIGAGFRLFFWIMVTGRGVNFKISGVEHLPQRPVVVVANHPTLVDVVAILGAAPHLSCLVKPALLQNFFVGALIRRAGYIGAETGPALVDICVAAVKGGESLVIFPEGTRSPAHGLRRFHRGAANIALRAGADIVPVVLDVDQPLLKKGVPWYAVPKHRPNMLLTFHSPIVCSQERSVPAALAARQTTRQLEDFFHQSLKMKENEAEERFEVDRG